MSRVNCAAIPETLIESEIFGHEKGAFTGAAERRAGCFELATGGTLLLDEIGEMPVGTQAKLLRVLEERKLRRLGARTEQDVDVRVLAATNRDPNTRGRRRPSARRPLLPAQCLQHPHAAPARAHGRSAGDGRSHARRDEPEARPARLRRCASMLDRLMAYDWPGNARELRNTIERAVILCPDGAPLDAGHLPPGFGKAQQPAASASDASLCRCTWAPPWTRPSGC